VKRSFLLAFIIIFALPVLVQAGNPVDVFKSRGSNKSDPYAGLLKPSQPAVESDGTGDNSASQKVKIDNKEAAIERSDINRSSGDEKGSLTGLESSQDDFSAGPEGVRTLGPDTEEGEENGQPFLGTWLRTATYNDGALMGQTPATLILRPDDYESSSTCYTSGSLITGGNTFTLSMQQSTCPGPSVTATYTYKISKDNTAMTIFTGPVMETYIRQK